jgi:hypothetical protein
MNLNTTEHIVMARVQRIHMLRRLLSSTLLKVYSAVVLGAVLVSLVSVANVYANMPSLTAPIAFGRFVIGAVTHTEFVVQLLLSGLAAVVVLLVRDIARMLPRHPGTWAHAY